MPQLEAVTYLCQYIWKLIVLFFLFSILVNFILPKVQRQVTIRNLFSFTEMGEEKIKLDTILLV